MGQDMVLELLAALVIGAGLGAGTVTLLHKPDTDTSEAVEAAVAPQVEAEDSLQMVLAQDPAHWLCDGEFADRAGCAWVVCLSINAAKPAATQAAGQCRDLADVYVSSLKEGK